jgi:hypothetical protein
MAGHQLPKPMTYLSVQKQTFKRAVLSGRFGSLAVIHCDVTPMAASGGKADVKRGFSTARF